MRVATVLSREVWSNSRLDAKFHLDDGDRAFRRVMSGRWPLTTPGEQFGEESIWSPNRFARVYVSGPEHGKPVMVPYDAFRFVPTSRDHLSRTQVAVYEKLELERGWLLMTCSGRNLGPVTLVDEYGARFVMSHDMIRVAVPLTDALMYFTAFLHTSVGQALVRRDKGGSVIDHISPPHVAAMRYPRVNPELEAQVVRLFRSGFEQREAARLTLIKARDGFLSKAGLEPERLRLSATERARRFTVNRSALPDRIDAEPNAPIYDAYRRHIRRSGGAPLSDLAEVSRPPGRYKTLYVEQAEHGIPILSGRQVAQYLPIGLKYMSPAAFTDPDEYRVREGMVLLTADGRAEENLADTAMVTADRDGWMASGHVHRLLPRKGVHPGLVYLAASCEPVQAQLKALATGSVVDALNESDVGSVLVPAPTGSEGLADDAARAWTLFAKATKAEREAVSLLERELLG